MFFLEVVQDANEKLLENEENYLRYILDQAEQIIKDYGIQYNDIQDNRKTYPKFTTKQFNFILTMLNKRIYSINSNLLKDNIYKYRYDIKKVELCFSVFDMLCSYYNISYNINMFLLLSGLNKPLMIDWLNTGKSKLYLVIIEKGHAVDDMEMLNSHNALLRMHYRNNEQIERLEEQNSDILPDLLLTDQQQKALTAGENPVSCGIVGKLCGIENHIENPEKAEKP